MIRDMTKPCVWRKSAPLDCPDCYEGDCGGGGCFNYLNRGTTVCPDCGRRIELRDDEPGPLVLMPCPHGAAPGEEVRDA